MNQENNEFENVQGNNELENEENNEIEKNVEEQPSNDESEEVDEEPQKTNWLAIILGVIVIALLTYIVWGKINKEEALMPIEQGLEQNDNTETEKYFETETITKTLNDKEIKIELKNWLKNEKEIDEEGNVTSGYMDETIGYSVNTDLYLNGKIYKTVGSYLVSDSIKLTDEAAIASLKNDTLYSKYLTSLKTFEVIKGDKDYLYNKQSGSETAKILVIDEDANIIFDETFGSDYRLVNLDQSCLNYQKFADQCKKEGLSCNTALYYIEDEAIYYIVDPGTCADTPSLASQYKLTFKNNKAVTEKVAECKFLSEGACS